MKLLSKYNDFLSRKWNWNVLCKNGKHFVWLRCFNTSRPRQSGPHCAGDILSIFTNEQYIILMQISQIYSKSQINDTPALIQLMVWCRSYDKPSSEPGTVYITDAYMAFLFSDDLTHEVPRDFLRSRRPFYFDYKWLNSSLPEKNARHFADDIHRWPVNTPHKGPVTRKMFPFEDVIMSLEHLAWVTIVLIYYHFFCGEIHMHTDVGNHLPGNVILREIY